MTEAICYFRCELEPEYKANRIDFHDVCESENPYSQLPDIYKALEFLGIKTFETIQCEADDLIASYVLSYTDINIVISSFDSDFFQLLSEKVSVLRYRGKKTAAKLLNDYGELDGIINMANHISKQSIRESIMRNANRLKKNYQLIKLKNNADLPFDKCELEYNDCATSTMEVLRRIGLK